MQRRSFLAVATGLPAFSQARKKQPAAIQGTPWTQWGGPNRNFQTVATGLKSQWPASGPTVLWKRPLGEGYSSPAVENGILYSMYGRPGQEIVIAADAGTGKTLWEHAEAISFRSDAPEMGNGPYATPLISGDRLFTAGVTGRLQCFDKKSGRVLWTQLLWSGHKGTRLDYGYASSPLAYRDLIIAPVGGRGRAAMAFKQSDGSIAWSRNDLENTYSSPLLINVDGLHQVVFVLDGYVVAMNPLNGDPQWQVPFKADYRISVATPVWGPGNLLFVSAEYNAGAKVIELRREGDKTTPREVWSSNRLRLHHGNAMRIGDVLYFSSGGKGSQAILSAVDVRTGQIYWQERSIPKATFVFADNKLITLDQDGTLMLAEPSPRGFTIVSKASLLENLSWSPPTLVGSRLYLRDRRTLMSVDLA